MNELLRKIYDTIICYEKDAVEMGWRIEEEIKYLIQPYQDKLTEDELEVLKNLLYGAALSGQREGFILGVQYTLKMLFTLSSN